MQLFKIYNDETKNKRLCFRVYNVKLIKREENIVNVCGGLYGHISRFINENDIDLHSSPCRTFLTKHEANKLCKGLNEQLAWYYNAFESDADSDQINQWLMEAQ